MFSAEYTLVHRVRPLRSLFEGLGFVEWCRRSVTSGFGSVHDYAALRYAASPLNVANSDSLNVDVKLKVKSLLLTVQGERVTFTSYYVTTVWLVCKLKPVLLQMRIYCVKIS